MAHVRTMTNRQIDSLVAKFRSVLKRHRSEVIAQYAEQVLGVGDLGIELYGVVRKHIECLVDLIFRTVTVNPFVTPQQVLDATGRRQCIDKAAVGSMPRSSGIPRKAVFFRLGRFISHDGLNQAVADHLRAAGLNPNEWEMIDPISLAKINGDDPAFADTHHNGTQWKDSDDKWCHAVFGKWGGERIVSVNCSDDDGWRDDWWFAVVREELGC